MGKRVRGFTVNQHVFAQTSLTLKPRCLKGRDVASAVRKRFGAQAPQSEIVKGQSFHQIKETQKQGDEFV